MFYPRAGVTTDDLKVHADIGARRAIVPLPAEGADVVLPLLDEYAKLMS